MRGSTTGARQPVLSTLSPDLPEINFKDLMWGNPAETVSHHLRADKDGIGQGVSGQVHQSGTIHVGDDIRVIHAASAPPPSLSS